MNKLIYSLMFISVIVLVVCIIMMDGKEGNSEKETESETETYVKEVDFRDGYLFSITDKNTINELIELLQEHDEYIETETFERLPTGGGLVFDIKYSTDEIHTIGIVNGCLRIHHGDTYDNYEVGDELIVKIREIVEKSNEYKEWKENYTTFIYLPIINY